MDFHPQLTNIRKPQPDFTHWSMNMPNLYFSLLLKVKGAYIATTSPEIVCRAGLISAYKAIPDNRTRQ